MANWSQLPKDLLHLIAKSLDTHINILRLRSVCSSWRSFIALPSKRHRHTPIPTVYDPQVTLSLTLSQRTVYLIESTQQGSPPIPKRWLVKVFEDQHGILHLLDPLSCSKVVGSDNLSLDLREFRVFELCQEHVLHRTTMYAVHDEDEHEHEPRSRQVVEVAKAALMCVVGSKNNDFVLVTPHSDGGLAFFDSRIEQWNTIGSHPATSTCISVTHFNNKFYAVDTKGRTITLDPYSSDFKVVTNLGSDGHLKYLVESGGDLLLVETYLSSSNIEEYFDNEGYKGLYLGAFEVFKLDKEGDNWVKLNSLEDRVLFLGVNSSFSVLASELPGCKGNCIVVTQPRWKGFNQDGYDIYVVDFETGIAGLLEDSQGYFELFSGDIGKDRVNL
uniref:F-box domain-containing protein n=1 Tax=Fagus sylvatica TaxID=28930 RepID=A0A2N9HBM6_FAGSY